MAKTRKTKADIHIDIVSDIVCPWCWLGYRYFQQAAKQTKHNIKLTWRPYMLDSDIVSQGVPYKDYMRAKFGDSPSNRFAQMRKHLETAGPNVGIDFRFDDIPIRPNTLAAHRLMRWAEGQGLGSAAAEALFRAFFTEHKDVGKPAILAAIAGELGMDAPLTEKLLITAQDNASVQEEIAFYRELGVNAVPTFIYNGQYAVQGAQPPQAHIQAIEEATKNPAES